MIWRVYMDGQDAGEIQAVRYGIIDKVRRIAKSNPSVAVVKAVADDLCRPGGGEEGVYVLDQSHPLVGSRWRSKDHRNVLANHNQDRRVVYVENWMGTTRRAALRADNRNHTALVKVVDGKVDRHERIA